MTHKIAIPQGLVLEYSISKNNSFFRILLKSLSLRSAILVVLFIVAWLQILAFCEIIPYLFPKETYDTISDVVNDIALSYICGCVIYFLTSVLKNWIWIKNHYKKYNKGKIYYNCNDILESLTWRLQTLLSKLKIDTKCIKYVKDDKKKIDLYPSESLNFVKCYDLWQPVVLYKGSYVPFIIGLNIILKEIKNFIEPLLFGNVILTPDQRRGFSYLYESEIYEVLELYIQTREYYFGNNWSQMCSKQTEELSLQLTEYLRGLYTSLGIKWSIQL